MKIKTTHFFLLITGITGIYIGASLLFTPISFEASAGIPVANNTNLLSEIRSSGGNLLIAGTCMLGGVFSSKITKISLMVCTLFYCSYGISRLIAMLMDGIPGKSLVIVTLSELFIGLISIILLRNAMRKEQHV